MRKTNMHLALYGNAKTPVEMVKKAPIGESVLFNVTCQHMVQQIECGVEKI
jgi:hypothetical protein